MSAAPALSQAITATVAYFDLFDYPLTAFEVWKWLYWPTENAPTSEHVATALPQIDQLESKDGFWFLKGRAAIVGTRQERHRISISKLRDARRFARYCSYLPWVEGIATCNSVGYRNATNKSDLDFFVITKPGALWLVRFLAFRIASVIGQKPTTTHDDMVCLSFFISSDALDLAPLRKGSDDIHFTYWATQFTPLFGRGKVWHDFWSANGWITQQLPNAHFGTRAVGAVYREAPHRWTLPGITRPLNTFFKQFQQRQMTNDIHALAARQDTDVVLSDTVLKFHTNDRRDLYREQWQQKMQQLIV